MKKILALIMVLVLGVSVVGCGKDQNISKLEKIKKKNKLVLGTSADYPPYEFHKEIDGKDEIVGFDIEIAKQIAKDLGVELEIKDMKFDGLLPALQAGNIDIVISGMSATEERAKSVDFTVPYYDEEQTIVIRKEDENKLKTKKDFKGLIVGAQKSSIQEEIANESLEANEVRALFKLPDLMLQLKNKKIDGIVLTKYVAKEYVKSNKDLKVMDITLKFDDSAVSGAVKKGEEELLKEVNKSLEKMIEEEKLQEFVVEAVKLAGEDK
ncbi:transporter substrate-binding domain-containing protein [Peptostreptococcaceae bacterium AGR-M142]